MTTAIDPIALKTLIQSNNIAKMQETVKSYDIITTDSRQQQEQLCKVRVLLWSRISGLQKAAGESQLEALTMIGRVWFAMGEIEKAIGQLQHAVTLYPKDIVVAQLLAEAHAELAQYDKAVVQHERAIQLLEAEGTDKKEIAVAYSKLANTYWLSGDFGQSLDLLKKAETLMQEAGLGGTDQDGVILGQMGQLLERTGDYEQAVAILTRAHKVLVITRGASDTKTSEIEFLLEMASNLVN